MQRPGTIGWCVVLSTMVACSGSVPTDTGSDEPGPTIGGGATEDTGKESGPAIADVTVEVHDDVSSVLIVEWTQSQAVDATWLEFTFEDDIWMSSPAKTGEAGAHREVILGVPAETDVEFVVVNQVGDDISLSETFTETTGDLPNELHDITVHAYDASLATEEGYLMGTMSEASGGGGYGSTMWVYIIDRQGRYVWYHEVPGSRLSLYSQVSADGTHILFDGTTNYVWSGDYEPAIWRATLDFEMFEEFEVPNMSFAFDETDDGTFLYDHRTNAYTLVERDEEGNEREIWSCTDYLQSIGANANTCQPNSVVWLRATDSVFWSMYNNDTVVEVDRESGEVLRQFGQLDGGYTFDPEDSVVDYQHYPSLTPDGNLITSTHTLGKVEQRASEWVFDDETETLTEIWRFDDAPYYATYGGEAYRLENGNTIIEYGTGGAVLEITYDQAVAWDLEWDSSPLLGHVNFIGDLYALNEGRSE